MALSEAAFDDEKELQAWAFDNMGLFLPDYILMPGSRIETASGKGGVPDGFAFNFLSREWHVIECELLQHGVWPHIAEQITRFVVALQNPGTIKTIRDRLFEHILDNDLEETARQQLDVSSTRLLQQLELFVETVQPGLVILIDEASRDLGDMAHALAIPTQTFRIKKLVGDDRIDYYSPDTSAPAIETLPPEAQPAPSSNLDVLELLGGGTLHASTGRFKCYQLDDSIVTLKTSRRYDIGSQNYWYGFSPASLQHMEDAGVTHIVLVMADYGFANVPIAIVREYLETAKESYNADGSVRHYHAYIKEGPPPTLFTTRDTPEVELADYFQPFD